ncbi:2-amino-4-hydroxy-6-hydroxymethyldihydropteridine diphosphokinase [Coprobacter tertius]|uniref:2-amino-4-hydroxy-6-hydroxymethyldihydropteridine pyrophosphokinase n=1 Tax=Coprobacter tertius TaxID=2944915 RepID=A0ABT1MIP8_9BACT|nr:2-amino-4-hydroxy-6-hydroxymethyldihydropteridine diphosphokinase [Coprobacter tertius]MCP9612472.1 2-amino-4-hydroxy-6-hydroxymethyldihydropteridine diphosphokinase [Coprobacter tertius]
MKINRAIIGLASNIKGGMLLVKKSCQEIKAITVSAKFSSCYETVPVSSIPQPNYHNCVGIIETEWDFDHLRERFKEMEKAAGRHPDSKRQGEIPLDIDIVVWNDEVVKPRDMLQDYMQIGLLELK